MAEKAAANPTWDAQSLREALILNVGFNFGPNPEHKIDDILARKAAVFERIHTLLEVDGGAKVFDFGSGGGFVANAAAKRYAEVHCLDISQTFLRLARKINSEVENIYYHQTEFGDFAPLAPNSFDAGYSVAVFIHFNFYDLVYHLFEVNRILRIGGAFYFDYLDASKLNLTVQPSIRRHLPGYRRNREGSIFNVVHPTSPDTLVNLTRQLGFSIVREFHPSLTEAANPAIVIRKNADADPSILASVDDSDAPNNQLYNR